MTRARGRSDANQAEIVAALRAAGVSVQDMHEIGGGCPDLLCGYRGISFAVEVKQPGGKLTPDERKWFANWRGLAVIIHSVDEALDFLSDLEAK